MTEKKFQVKRNKQKNAVGLYDKNRNFNKNSDNLTKSEKLMNGVAKWASFYRQRPDIFVEEYLGINLKPFQKILLYVMIHYNYTAFFASRGLGKSFLTALYCVVRCILYPGTKIVVASKTKEQAMVLVSEKIPELMQFSKTGMIEREIDGSIKTSLNTPDPNVVFLNGSWIKVVPANQNARSKRANLLVLDEFRMIDFSVYKNVLRRFLAVSRQPGFLTKPEYKNRTDLRERNQEIYLSSAWYKFNWSFSRFTIHLKSMIKGKKYFVCGLPYQIAIRENLVNKDQLMDELREDDIDEIGWEMEMNCMFFGESEKAFFKTEELEQVRGISKPVYPKYMYELIKSKKFSAPIRKSDEIRVLCVDIAMIGDKANDASIFSLMQLFPYKKKTSGSVEEIVGYKRYFSYMESMLGGHTELQAIKIRQLMNDLDCDYLVLDRMGNGIGVYDALCKNMYDTERDEDYDAIQSMNDDKLKERCQVPNAKEIIFTMAGTSELNSEIAISLKDNIRKKKVKLLIGKNDSNDILNNIKGFHDLTMESQVDLMQPYKQYDMLVNEMVLLEGERKDNGIIKLKEQKNERKDRYSSISYGNYFANVLEKDLIKVNDKYNWNDYFIIGSGWSN